MISWKTPEIDFLPAFGDSDKPFREYGRSVHSEFESVSVLLFRSIRYLSFVASVFVHGFHQVSEAGYVYRIALAFDNVLVHLP